MRTKYPELMMKIAGLPRHVQDDGGGSYGAFARKSGEQGRAASVLTRHFNDGEAAHQAGQGRKIGWTNAERKIADAIEAGSAAKELAKTKLDQNYKPSMGYADHRTPTFAEQKKGSKSEYKLTKLRGSNSADLRRTYAKRKADISKASGNALKYIKKIR